ncbi:MAG: L-threonylcarbamoyladenylate synthase [Candidatus Kaiserbacteria bacterium]|nr:L-threonylcarbamoyladenylate synthase [Candidatus Kaiserbacteria bacterium]
MSEPIIYTEQEAPIEEICETLAAGKVIVYPTDTLYALGADPQQSKAIEKLFTLKQRSQEKKIAYIFSDLEQVSHHAKITDVAKSLVKYLPGKLTIILESKKNTGETIGVRIPDNEFCRTLATTYGPITATSANISGEKDPNTISDILQQLSNGIALAIDGGVLHGPASTVVDARGDTIKILRQGAVTI